MKAGRQLSSSPKERAEQKEADSLFGAAHHEGTSPTLEHHLASQEGQRIESA